MESEPNLSFDDTEVAFSYKSDEELKNANFIFSMVNHPWISAMATGAVKTAFSLGLPIEGIIKKTAFAHFCGGISIEDSRGVIEKLGAYRVGTILDYSVEGEDSEAAFDKTMNEVIRTINNAANSTHIPFSVFKPTGVASASVLEKIQRNIALTESEKLSAENIHRRFDKICATAHAMKVRLLIDAEDSWYQDAVDDIVEEMMAKYNREKTIVFNTYQLYRTESLINLKKAFDRAKDNNYLVGAKLVRGAYMEKERERAAKFGYPSPIHATKEDTDNAFNDALSFCVEHVDRISVMCGSHNEQSNRWLATLMTREGIAHDDPRVWFAQLYGMSDHISFTLAGQGYNVAKYVPYGPVRAVMPYLLRRAEENTSVAGQSSRELLLIRAELKRRKASR